MPKDKSEVKQVDRNADKDGDVKFEIEENRKSILTKKLIRVVTVVAYVAGVSGAGVLMSLYYIVFWDPEIKGVKPPSYLKENEVKYDAAPLLRSQRSIAADGNTPNESSLIVNSHAIINVTDPHQLDPFKDPKSTATSTTASVITSVEPDIPPRALNYVNLPLLKEEGEEKMVEGGNSVNGFKKTNGINLIIDLPNNNRYVSQQGSTNHEKNQLSHEKKKKSRYESEEHRKAIRHSQMMIDEQ